MNERKVSRRCHQSITFLLYKNHSEVYGTPTDFTREERFTMNGDLDPRYLKRGNIDTSEIAQRLTSYEPTNKKSPLEKALGLEAGRVQLFYHVPRFMAVEYRVSTIHDMMELEFTKMLELGTRLAK